MTLSPQQFLNKVNESGVLLRENLAEFVDSCVHKQRFSDSSELARLFVQHGKLTRYQAQQIYSGNGQELVFGSYVVLEKIGQGGMGMVFKAEHRKMERVVALKVLSPSMVDSPDAVVRFHREVKAAAKLEHPNVVTAYDAGESNGTHFMVMQYVKGADLSEIVKRNGALPTNRAFSCIVQAAAGLAYAHQQGIVHRDIKPANLLMDENGNVKILDMGLARLDFELHGQDQLTTTGQIMGTIDYMAPEQAVNTRNADARADIYSLGATMWFLLTGRVLYEGDSLMAKLLAHREASIPSLQEARQDISPELNRIFRKMVGKAPETRFLNIDELLNEMSGSREIAQVAAVGSSANRLPNIQARPPAGSNPLIGGGESALISEFDPDQDTGAFIPQVEGGAPTATINGPNVGTDPNQLPLPASSLSYSQAQSYSPSLRPSRKKKSSFINRFIQFPRILVGVITLAVFAAMFFLGIVLFLQTKHGVIRVEINDPKIEVKIKGTDIVLAKADKGQDIKLSPGEKTLVVEREGFKFETNKLILRRNEEVIVKVELLQGEIQVRKGDIILGKEEIPDSSPRIALNPKPTDQPQKGIEKKPDLPKQVKSDVEKIDRNKESLPNEMVSENQTLSVGDPAPAISPFSAEKAKQHQEEWAKHLGVQVEITNSIGMKFRVVPPGEFMMGSSKEEIAKLLAEAKQQQSQWSIERIPQEGPRHKVTLTKPFGVSIYEVTRGQFRQFVEATGYKTDAEKDGKGGFGYKGGRWVQSREFLWDAVLGFENEQTDEHPVVNVSWNDAMSFCEWLSKKEGVTYRLPKEAEWEFACRAGNQGSFSFGDDRSKLGDYAWYGSRGGPNTRQIGQKAPNPFGLFDLHGNVAEWCYDPYASYSIENEVDPVGAKESNTRALRGGSFYLQPQNVRSAARSSFQPNMRNDNYGFRIVRNIENKKTKNKETAGKLK